MTDDQVEKFIWSQIKRKKVIFGDMIAPSNHGVDPNPEAGYEDRTKRLRGNIFTQNFGNDRMKELLCIGRYSPDSDYPPLKIPFNDLFRFWWNRCVDKELAVDNVLEEIFEYFKEQMRPPMEEQEEEPEMSMTVNFEEETFCYPETESEKGLTVGRA
jgi:hypothetical protein